MVSSSDTASTPQLPGPDGQGGEGFWEKYLRKVSDDDIRLITRWQKILDTLLVYVGLFIGVLTAFIIQLSSFFQPSPGDATNKILIAIYNHTVNASSPVDLRQYIKWDETFNSVAPESAFLLYISLAVSVTEAASALIINIWLTRYQRSLTETGPTIHERIRKRQEAYRGLMEWRLPILIEILPMMALVALVLFASSISKFVWVAHPIAGSTLLAIFLVVAIFFVMTASFAAFIPEAPFHSPLSGLVRLTFQFIPNRSIRGVIRMRTIYVTLMYFVSQIGFFTAIPWFIYILLQFLLFVSIPSLCQSTEKIAQEQPKPPIVSRATWVSSNCVIIIALSLMMEYVPSYASGFVFFSLRALMIFVMTVGARKTPQWTSDEGKSKVEALTWMIKTQPSHDLDMFQNALEIARNSAHLRSTLLKDILPVLDVCIKSIRSDREQDLKKDEKIYVTLLAVLVDFEPSKAVIWRNEAAVERPVLSDELKERLRILHQGDCAHILPVQFGCTKAEAGFILGKVDAEDRIQTQSPNLLWFLV